MARVVTTRRTMTNVAGAPRRAPPKLRIAIEKYVSACLTDGDVAAKRPRGPAGLTEKGIWNKKNIRCQTCEVDRKQWWVGGYRFVLAVTQPQRTPNRATKQGCQRSRGEIIEISPQFDWISAKLGGLAVRRAWGGFVSARLRREHRELAEQCGLPRKPARVQAPRRLGASPGAARSCPGIAAAKVVVAARRGWCSRPLGRVRQVVSRT